MQLTIILISLQDSNHIATLLGFSDTQDIRMGGGSTSQKELSDLQLSEILMKTVLRNLAYETVKNHVLDVWIKEICEI